MKYKVFIFLFLLVLSQPESVEANPSNDPVESNSEGDINQFPPSLASYQDDHLQSISQILQHRIKTEPINLIATIIFFCAIVHTFLVGKIIAISRRRKERHAKKMRLDPDNERSVDLSAELLHFLGEVEVIFGLWLVPLVVAITLYHDWPSTSHYIHNVVDFSEPAFIVVIMVIASTRPILRLAERMMSGVARLFGGSLSVLWFSILTLGPLLGSFITEPAAMTICAMLLSQKFYELGPSTRLKYATLALLFVNISVGGVLTNFAAPPVLMVAEPWGWGINFMLLHFGWKVIIGILLANSLYFLLFRQELASMQEAFAIRDLKDDIERKYLTQQATEAIWTEVAHQGNERERLFKSMRSMAEHFVQSIRKKMEDTVDISKLEELGYDKKVIQDAAAERFEEAKLYRTRRFMPLLLQEKDRAQFLDPDWDQRDDPVPPWITIVHALFMVWTIFNAHNPEFFILGFLFFLGFTQISSAYQNRIHLKPALLVGFFLAGLVIHGGLQSWWIAPVLGNLSERTLMITSTVLTAFNDNAAITYLSTLVPGFTDSLKYSVVAGAIAGGGLTIIANAPNPAGQSLLKKHFNGTVSPQRLLTFALIPTLILWLCLALL